MRMVNNIILKHNYTAREMTVVKIFKMMEISSFLNIGFHNWEKNSAHWWINICNVNNIDWMIVEAYYRNVKDAIKQGCPENKIIKGNITYVDRLPKADCIFFWHGPEHVKKKQFLRIIPKLEQKYKYVIFGMSIGHEPQGIAYGNKYERHISSWRIADWENLGYQVFPIFDGRDFPHMTVYKNTEL